MGSILKVLTSRKRAGGWNVIRVAKRTKLVAPTLRPNEIVIISHLDIDGVAAESLVRAKPLAVINTRKYVSGRYPNQGPQILLDAGITLYESADESLLQGLDRVFGRIEDCHLVSENGRKFPLEELFKSTLQGRLQSASLNLNAELDAFVENTLAFVTDPVERSLLLEPLIPPGLKTDFFDQITIVVVRGNRYREDLRLLGAFIRDSRPKIIAVDGAADELLSINIRPDVILGDMDSVSDRSLKCGAEVVVHTYPADHPLHQESTALKRVEMLGIHAIPFPVRGTSEDAALLLAHESGAKLIVAVGTHTHMEDFLDKGRSGMASTFLVRLKVGSKLVDAKGVSRLLDVQQPVAVSLGFLFLAALFPIGVLLLVTPVGQVVSRGIILIYKAWAV